MIYAQGVLFNINDMIITVLAHLLAACVFEYVLGIAYHCYPQFC